MAFEQNSGAARVISGFCLNVDEICALLGYYTALSASSVPKFWVKKPKKTSWTS
jgi:hypothetical protein